MKNLKVIIEIPQNSAIKYEYNREIKSIEVDRILRDNFVYPCNYGCIEEALDWDGDPLDILVYSEHSLIPGCLVNVHIIGAMQMIDDGETDTKLIGVLTDEFATSTIKNLSDLPASFLKKVKTFFETYKNWKRPNITSVPGFQDKLWAEKEYHECVALMQKYGHLSKEDFLKEMKEKHPEKYLFD